MVILNTILSCTLKYGWCIVLLNTDHDLLIFHLFQNLLIDMQILCYIQLLNNTTDWLVRLIFHSEKYWVYYFMYLFGYIGWLYLAIILKLKCKLWIDVQYFNLICTNLKLSMYIFYDNKDFIIVHIFHCFRTLL